MFKRIRVKARKPYELITDQIYRSMPQIQKVESGVAVLLRASGSAVGSLTVNENADPSVRDDFEAAIPRVVKDFGGKIKNDSLFGYLQGAMMSNALTLVISRGRFVFGTWQGIYANTHGKKMSSYNHDIDVFVVPCKHKSSLTSYTAKSRGSHIIDDDVLKEYVKSPLIFLSVLHTSASLSISYPGASNLETKLNRIAPARWNREFLTHTYEGDDDMPGHLKSSICGVSLAIPSEFLRKSASRIQLNEHRDCGGWGGGHTRKISCLGVAPTISKTISNVPVGKITNLILKYVDEMKKLHNQVKVGIVVVSVANPDCGVKLASSSFLHSDLTSFFTSLADGDLRMGLTICGRSTCLPFESKRGVYFGGDDDDDDDRKNELFLLGNKKSQSDVFIGLLS